ncbi:MAG: hypothetical protein ACXWAC_07990 [Usitatibacter sp.]
MQPIRFGDEGRAATRELLRRFDTLALQLRDMRVDALRGQLGTLESIDRQHGGGAALADADELVAAAITGLAHLEAESGRSSATDAQGEIADLTLGVALWAMRHDVAVKVVEPVANALAVRSNRAASAQELAAVFGLMQGLIAHVKPQLAADLERSNPERPWRVLHANFAITAIRTGDPALMDFAFDALDEALPDERAGFYSEALALAMAPRFPAAVRERIEARHLKWTSAIKT